MQNNKLCSKTYFTRTIYQISVITYTHGLSFCRIFCYGRTETIRPVSDYSAQWVKSMQNERATREQRAMLLRKAVQCQTQYKVDASCGLVWDRHLFGLYAVCRELNMPLPALFQDKVLYVAIKFANLTFSLVRRWDITCTSFDTWLHILRGVLSKLLYTV